MSKIITHMSFKGGAGKTTLNINFALEYCALNKDKKVLFIDADPQSNATNKLLRNKDLIKYTLKDALEKNISLEDLIIKAPIEKFQNLDLIASDIRNVTLELFLNTQPAREFLLLNYLTEEKNMKLTEKYDVIIFDLNPAISVLNTNVFICCNKIIPVLNYGCVDTINGLFLLTETYSSIKKALRLNKDDIAKPIINKFKKTETNLIKNWIRKAEEDNILNNTFKQTIRESVNYAETIQEQENISKYLGTKKSKPDIENEFKDLIEEYKEENIL